MSLFAIILILISAALHAGWNLFSKRQQPTIAFFFIATAAGLLCISPYLLWQWSALGLILHEVGGKLLLTGFCMAAYYAALAGAYRHGEISIAYPLARAAPIVLVSFLSLALEQGQPLCGLFALGVALVVLGCIALPMRHWSDLRPANYLNVSCGMAMLAALGTTGYSLLDDAALRQLRSLHHLDMRPTSLTVAYGGLEALSCMLWLGLFIVLIPSETGKLRHTLRVAKYQALLTGLVIWIAYLLVLIALAYADNVSYIVAFRQISIPLGAMLGILILKEQAAWPKLAGVSLMFVGLTLVALG